MKLLLSILASATRATGADECAPANEKVKKESLIPGSELLFPFFRFVKICRKCRTRQMQSVVVMALHTLIR